jgi:NRAMP (natural resistance-associated macrophage protein)-like metal ion transporter
MWHEFKEWLHRLGPGFITGVADDDPSGIATYSQAGAAFGTGMLWTALFCFPLMAAVQEISARIGRVSGHGLAGNMCRHYRRGWLYMVVLLITVANIINIGADIAGMAASLALVLGPDKYQVYPVAISLLSVLALTLLSYSVYTSVLKWVGLSIFAYVGIVFFVQIPWGDVVRDTLIPRLQFSHGYLSMLTAVLGTTISPYLFIWQSSLEVEEQRADPHERPVVQAPEQAEEQFSKVRIDTYAGMAVSSAVTFFIILTTAVTLHAHHITHIASAAQAAQALEPIAGPFAFALFAVGIIGTGLLAIPTLSGSIGYAVGEAFRWPTGLDYRPYQARRFYAVIAVATLAGTCMNFVGIDPIRALIGAALINGLLSVPLLFLLMAIARDRAVMGGFVIPPKLAAVGWAATALMSASVLLTLFDLASGPGA